MADVAVKNLEVAILGPRKARDAAGAKATPVSPKTAKFAAGIIPNGARNFASTCPCPRPGRFDALLLPGGVINPDKMRMDPKAVAFVKSFIDSDKPVAAICHGPWMVLEAGGARGRRMTSWPSLKTDLKNAGANWVDQEVVTDGMLTSRKPDDIAAFNREMIKQFANARVAQPAK